ncbi:ATP-grasp domain-containing protein [Brevundimonas sp.]|uniref:ATP-grasp domain-containing protein n=1 Tax=Brevundimonas sp. TaxID=1871086 RepID=UPI003F71F949
MAERVLITGARAVAAPDMARSLRTAGYEPHLADCVPARLARWSNSAGPVHRYASPVERPAVFAADLRALIARLDPIKVIPACEEVFHLSALAVAEGWSDRLLAPGPKVLATLHAKDRFAALCARLSLPIPETRTVTDAPALLTAVEAMGDVVVKPVWSRFGAAHVSPSPSLLAAIRPGAASPWVVQKRIVGEEICFHAVTHDGRIRAFAAYGSEWRLPGGAAYAFQPVTEALTEALRPIADRLAMEVWTGQFACDVLIDDAGQPWLIECNPRATSGVHRFGGSAAFGRALMGKGEAAPDSQSRHIAPALWRYGRPSTRASGRMEAWRAQRRKGLDVLTRPGDRMPLPGALLDTLGFGLRALRRGQSLTAAMTADIEWNGEPLDPARWSRP